MNEPVKVKRNPWLDSLKAFAIYLVIAGHAMNNCIENGDTSRVSGVIYFIHIPLFLVISGVLTKDKPMDIRFWRNILLRFVLPYTVWTIILTTFYLGIDRLLHDGVQANALVYLKNWGHSFLWFIKVYIIIYVLWQALKKLSPVIRLIVGTALLVMGNLLFLDEPILSELLSLSLYSYTLYGTGVCMRSYASRFSSIHLFLFLLAFVCCLPFATPANNYFNCSFRVMFEQGNWHVFVIRYIAGVSTSLFLIHCKSVEYKLMGGVKIWIQKIGKRTLQIYLLQSLLVEAALNRIFHAPNEMPYIVAAFVIAAVMTYLCSLIVGLTSRSRLCRLFLWGMK